MFSSWYLLLLSPSPIFFRLVTKQTTKQQNNNKRKKKKNKKKAKTKTKTNKIKNNNNEKLFAGLLINLNDIPVYFRWLEYISIFKYALQATAVNEFTGLEFNCPPEVPGPCFETGEQYLEFQGYNPDALWYDILALFLMAVIYLFLSFVGLSLIRAK